MQTKPCLTSSAAGPALQGEVKSAGLRQQHTVLGIQIVSHATLGALNWLVENGKLTPWSSRRTASSCALGPEPSARCAALPARAAGYGMRPSPNSGAGAKPARSSLGTRPCANDSRPGATRRKRPGCPSRPSIRCSRRFGGWKPPTSDSSRPKGVTRASSAVARNRGCAFPTPSRSRWSCPRWWAPLRAGHGSSRASLRSAQTCAPCRFDQEPAAIAEPVARSMAAGHGAPTIPQVGFIPSVAVQAGIRCRYAAQARRS